MSRINKIFAVGIFFLFLSLKTDAAEEQPTALQPSGYASFETAVEEVAKNIGPTVVSILTEQTIQTGYRNPFRHFPFQDDILRHFFEDFYGGLPQSQFKRSGLGSGVIIDKRGFILTNKHVVEVADNLTVTLSDGRKFSATLKGVDQRSDLAIIKIDAPDLPVANLGDSDNLKIGQWVVAIGNPFGHILSNPEPTVTTGVVSALNRSLPQTSRMDDYTGLIQTDAAINPGNSGGPLVNLQGEVIGINVAIFSTSGGYQGIGFAIPSNDAKRIVDEVIEGRRVSYGWIGISIQDLDDRLAQYFGLSTIEGVLIVKVLRGAPADKAGLREGDIIVAANDKKITNTGNLLRFIGNAPINKEINLKVFRDKKEVSIPVKIAERPTFGQVPIQTQEESKKEETSRSLEETTNQWRGLTVLDITDELAERLRLDTKEGVVITHVTPNSPADLSGLRNGDIIIGLNKESVKNVKDFAKSMSKVRGGVLVQTLRGYFVVEEN